MDNNWIKGASISDRLSRRHSVEAWDGQATGGNVAGTAGDGGQRSGGAARGAADGGPGREAREAPAPPAETLLLFGRVR